MNTNLDKELKQLLGDQYLTTQEIPTQTGKQRMGKYRLLNDPNQSLLMFCRYDNNSALVLNPVFVPFSASSTGRSLEILAYVKGLTA